ncbi:MAG TPA: helix-turn-helix transcriptional regulator [Fusibacter sp.]|nr:helix-turn-helix transcriptional regulator [Fusibacter sp.]
MTKTLKTLIKNNGMTQRDLAKLTGIPEITINSWVSGKNVPKLNNAYIIAKALNVSLDELAQVMGLDTIDDGPSE